MVVHVSFNLSIAIYDKEGVGSKILLKATFINDLIGCNVIIRHRFEPLNANNEFAFTFMFAFITLLSNEKCFLITFFKTVIYSSLKPISPLFLIKRIGFEEFNKILDFLSKGRL